MNEAASYYNGWVTLKLTDILKMSYAMQTYSYPNPMHVSVMQLRFGEFLHDA